LDNLQIPSLTQKTPLSISPSLNIISPLFIILVVLQPEILKNLSFVKDFKELNCQMIHCSHLLIGR